jgi:D-amino peptidase
VKRLIFCILLFGTLCFSQGPRIFIVTDLEGAGGVNDRDEQLLPGQRRYMESRHILTGEVNAAISGALAAGAGQVVIWDGHDGSRTLSIDEINSSARLLQGKPTPANYYLGPKLYDGIFFIGQHAMAGAKNGVLAHSQSFNVKRITINGREVGEIGQVAAIAGQFDIPVVMLAGDEAACAEVKELQPNAITVAVKRLAGRASSISLSHEEAKRQILEAARQAVTRIAEYRPWKVAGPVELKMEFLPVGADTPGRVASYRGATVLEAYESWLGKLP